MENSTEIGVSCSCDTMLMFQSSDCVRECVVDEKQSTTRGWDGGPFFLRVVICCSAMSNADHFFLSLRVGVLFWKGGEVFLLVRLVENNGTFTRKRRRRLS